MPTPVPFNRLGWIGLVAFLPAALFGYLSPAVGEPFPVFCVVFHVTAAATMGLVTLATWLEQTQRAVATRIVGIAAMAALLVLLFRYVPEDSGMQMPLLYLVPATIVSAANPEGIPLLMILGNAVVAGGLAVYAPLSGKLAVPLLALGLGLVVSLARRLAR